MNLLRWGRVETILYLRRYSECVGECRSNARINTIDVCQIKTIYNTFCFGCDNEYLNIFRFVRDFSSFFLITTFTTCSRHCVHELSTISNIIIVMLIDCLGLYDCWYE